MDKLHKALIKGGFSRATIKGANKLSKPASTSREASEHTETALSALGVAGFKKVDTEYLSDDRVRETHKHPNGSVALVTTSTAKSKNHGCEVQTHLIESVESENNTLSESITKLIENKLRISANYMIESVG